MCRDALDINFPLHPEELRMHESPTSTFSVESQNYNQGVGGNVESISLKDSFSSMWPEDPLSYSSTDSWPQPEGIRLLVAVTSACCTQVSLQRRAAIRRTWAALIKERYRDTPASSISIQFFLAQPKNETVLTEWLPHLEEEILAHNDTVVVRGKDVYFNLPNKTFRMLRYTLAHPREYTHVLKADDDTWVRMHKILEYLYDKGQTQAQAPPVKMRGADTGESFAGKSEEETSARSSNAAVIAAAIRRKAELQKMSRERGVPLVSEGMTLYDASNLLHRVDWDQRYGKETVDDIDGGELTLEELARRSDWHYTHEGRDEMLEKEKKDLIEQQDGSLNTGFRDGGVDGGRSGKEEEEEEEVDTFGGERRKLQQQRQQQQNSDSSSSSSSSTSFSFSARPRMSGVYLGCIENQKGFQPIRDINNKWYVSEEALPSESYPHGVKYLAGWGYLLSRDFIMHIVQKVNSYESQPESAPLWYTRIAFEDVLVGLLLHDVVPFPESHSGFRPAWRSCVPDTAVRHLDLDSPRLLKALVEQDASGLADEKPVQCSSGQFLPGDYAGWYAWKASLVS